MSVSRKSPGEEPEEQVNEDYEMTQEDYLADKKDCQDRTGYDARSQEELEQKAVDEKLPSGSDSY